MLARHADNLFWMARYLERSENLSRRIQATLHHALSREDEGEEEIDGDSSIKDLERRMRKGFVQDMMYTTGRGSGTWGEMKIHEPPLTTNLQSRLRNGRAYRPADYGYSPKYINRWCTDKKIFKQKIRVLGGTILIDASGSMSFSADDLLELSLIHI